MFNMFCLRQHLNRTYLPKSFLFKYSTSIKPISKENEEHYEKELKQFETLTNITKRTRQKKSQRPPFVKNLLLGTFDTEILTFPQLEKEEVQNVEKETDNLGKILKQKHMIGANSLSNKNFRQNLSDVKAIGLQASQFLDGRESTPLEVMKYLQVFSEHRLGDSIIHHEQLGLQTLVKYGSELLQKKYLYPVIKGEKLLAFCLNENKINDIQGLNTKAELSKDKKYWILNGQKSYVVNGISADYLIVFALTDVVIKDSGKEVKLTVFLVEKDFQGVKWEKIEGSDIELANIVFENTEVPCENVIGEVNNAEGIINTIITDFRLSCGAACSTLTKNLINKLVNKILEDSCDNLELYKTQTERYKLGELAANLYAAESAAYLTAGLQDWYENQDTAVESAIVKVLSSEAAYNASTICLDAVGLSAVSKNHWTRTLHEKAIDYLTLYETNENQRLFIALTGLQHAGLSLAEKIKKIRNPLFHGAFTLMRAFAGQRDLTDDPKLNLGLKHYLHPSLGPASEHLEYGIKRLEFATENILSKYGLEVINEHVDLCRLANVIIECYAMTAVLARASRSYCIGLQNSDCELLLAAAYCNAAKDRVQKTVISLYSYVHKNIDQNVIDVGKQMTKRGEYFIKNPLTRNF